jgi:hypothetical protein
MDQARGLQQANLVKMALASPVHAVSRPQLHQSQVQEEFPAIQDGGLLQSTLHSEQGIYKKRTGQLALLRIRYSAKNIEPHSPRTLSSSRHPKFAHEKLKQFVLF